MNALLSIYFGDIHITAAKRNVIARYYKGKKEEELRDNQSRLCDTKNIKFNRFSLNLNCDREYLS